MIGDLQIRNGDVCVETEFGWEKVINPLWMAFKQQEEKVAVKKK